MTDEEEARKIVAQWQKKTQDAWLDGFAFAFESINDFMDDMKIMTIDRVLLYNIREYTTKAVKEKMGNNNGQV